MKYIIYSRLLVLYCHHKKIYEIKNNLNAIVNKTCSICQPIFCSEYSFINSILVYLYFLRHYILKFYNNYQKC